jgi:hypothetical protein
MFGCFISGNASHHYIRHIKLKSSIGFFRASSSEWATSIENPSISKMNRSISHRSFSLTISGVIANLILMNDPNSIFLEVSDRPNDIYSRWKNGKTLIDKESGIFVPVQKLNG